MKRFCKCWFYFVQNFHHVDSPHFFGVIFPLTGKENRVNTGGGIPAEIWAQARMSMFEAPDWTSEPALGTVSSVPRISRIYADGDRHLDMKLSVTNVPCKPPCKESCCVWKVLSHKLTEYSEYYRSFGDLKYNKQTLLCFQATFSKYYCDEWTKDNLLSFYSPLVEVMVE